jgi:hypothetical protein
MIVWYVLIHVTDVVIPRVEINSLIYVKDPMDPTKIHTKIRTNDLVHVWSMPSIINIKSQEMPNFFGAHAYLYLIIDVNWKFAKHFYLADSRVFTISCSWTCWQVEMRWKNIHIAIQPKVSRDNYSTKGFTGWSWFRFYWDCADSVQ